MKAACWNSGPTGGLVYARIVVALFILERVELAYFFLLCHQSIMICTRRPAPTLSKKDVMLSSMIFHHLPSRCRVVGRYIIAQVRAVGKAAFLMRNA